MAIIIDGKKVSAQVKEQVRIETEEIVKKGIKPGLAVIIVGDDPASRVYVNNKKKACEKVGFLSKEFALPATTTQEELLSLVKELNEDKEINGILCQLPLPKGLDEKAVIEAISPLKDVDAFHASNVGKIMIGDYDFLPCTPAGVMEMLHSYNIPVEGKECVVIGRSNIVGKPMAMLLLHENGTVTITHSRTKNLKEVTKRADILVAAIGKPKFVTADMVKEGAVVIDVGMDRDENGKLCGDVDFENVKEKCSAITPVPGGVGPMTIAVLMKNTLKACKIQNTAPNTPVSTTGTCSRAFATIYSYSSSALCGSPASVKLGRFPFLQLAYRVNCETIRSCPSTSARDLFVFPFSSSKIRSPSSFFIYLSAVASSSPWPTPIRTRKPF